MSMQPIALQPAGSFNPVAIPRHVVQQRFRTPKKNIPQTPVERNHILQAVRALCRRVQAGAAAARRTISRCMPTGWSTMLKCDPIYRDYIGVLLNNEMWRETLASVPFERRLLLLPKCLRVESKCPAPFDEFGLLCKQCGLCSIQDLQAEAERLGYAVLVAEGSAIVMSLIQTGKIEAIVGVSCLSVLERAFPYMEAAAIPGVAVPLLQDDCIDTTVDLDWVWDYIHLTSDDQTRRLDLERACATKSISGSRPLNLDSIMGTGEGETEQIAREWLMRAGKRWRPFLTVAAFQALRDDTRRAAARRSPEDRRRRGMFPQGLAHPRRHRGQRRAALRRKDAARRIRRRRRAERRRPAHRRRLSAARRLPGSRAEQKAADAPASPREGQRELCRGQGAELCWARNAAAAHVSCRCSIFSATRPRRPSTWRCGWARFTPASSCTRKSTDVLQTYSEALGIAYQIRDDLSDLGASGETNDIAGLRPSLLLAVAYETSRQARQKRDARIASGAGNCLPDVHRARSKRSTPNSKPTNARRDLLETLQGRSHPLPARSGEPEPQRTAPPRHRQDLQRHRNQRLVQGIRGKERVQPFERDRKRNPKGCQKVAGG